VGPRAGLDAIVKRKIPSPAGTQTPYHPARSPALFGISTLPMGKESERSIK